MTRTITMVFPVPQEGEQLENINHVIRALSSPVTIDWRDEMTVEVTITGNFRLHPDGVVTY